jgi:molybdopterin-synthase adenylyltransferase
MPHALRPGMVDEDRLERSRRIDWLDLEKVRSTRFLVVGAGALGNEVVKNLVLYGATDILLVDMDRVVRSNLNRCVLFREGDAANKEFKAEVVARRAMELVPSAVVRPLIGRIEDLPEADWSNFDIVLGCVDNIAARLHANGHAYHAKVPYIDGGTDGFAGRVQVVVPPDTPCLQCGLNRTHYQILKKRHSCTGAAVTFFEPKMAAEITTTAIVAAVQVREAVKLLSGQADRCLHHVLYYHGLRGSWDELELTIDPDCPLHHTSSSER